MRHHHHNNNNNQQQQNSSSGSSSSLSIIILVINPPSPRVVQGEVRSLAVMYRTNAQSRVLEKAFVS
jgi:superfamily I DNA/RNA helicase